MQIANKDGVVFSVGYASQWDVPLSGICFSVGCASQWDMPLSGICLSVGYASQWDMLLSGICRWNPRRSMRYGSIVVVPP